MTTSPDNQRELMGLGATSFCKSAALESDGMVQEGQTLPAGGAGVSPALKK